MDYQYCSLQEIVDQINGPYAPEAEEQAAEYAATGVDLDNKELLLRQVEANLELLEQAGARFDWRKACDLARSKVIDQLLDEAEQELGSDSEFSARVSWLSDDRGVVADRGDFMDEITAEELLRLGAERMSADS